MPGKQARVLCPVCQEPIPPDETECETCGAFVIDEAVVRLSRAFGLDRDQALKLFEAGFRHPTQLRDRDPNRILEKGEVGTLFICTNCGGFVAAGDSKCPRCAAEFESEPESVQAAEEGDILDMILCPVCGADNDPALKECEICGESLRGEPIAPEAAAIPPAPVPPPTREAPEPVRPLERFEPPRRESETPVPEPPRSQAVRRVPPPPMIPRDRRGPTMVKQTPKVARPPAAIARPPIERRRPAAPPARRPVAMKPGPRPAVPVRAKPPSAPTTPLRTRPPAPVLMRKRAAARTQSPARVQAAARPPSAKAKKPSRPTPLPQKKIREPSRFEFSPETYAGIVLAAGAGLLIAGLLGNQRLVSAGIAGVLAGLSKHVLDRLRHRTLRRPPDLESDVLIVAIALGILAPFFRASASLVGISLALASASSFAWLTLRLVRTPQRILLAAGCALSLFSQGLVEYLDPAYAMSPSWMVGILAMLPWPAAVATVEITRRQNATVLRRQVVRAEQNVERKNFEQSLAEYDQAIASTSPDTPGAEVPWYGKGATLILLGRYEEALRAIDRALDINPRNEVAWVNKGNALSRMGRHVDALRAFNAAIKVNALYEVAWNNKGNALARLGKFEEALRCYERALGIDPGYRGAWVNMGFVLTKMGRFDEAASCADRALQLGRGHHAEPV